MGVKFMLLSRCFEGGTRAFFIVGVVIIAVVLDKRGNGKFSIYGLE